MNTGTAQGKKALDAWEITSLLGLAGAFTAAVSSGLLDALMRESSTAEGYARSLSLDARATERILDVLVAFELVTRDGDKFALDPTVRNVVVQPLGPEWFYKIYGYGTEFLRTGKPLHQIDDGAASRNAVYSTFVSGLGRMYAKAAATLASKLPFPKAPGRILDIGCGSGVWSLALAERYPEARVTGLDLPDVVATFRSRAEEQGLAARIDTIAGDVYAVAIPEKAFDLVIVANVVRLEEPARAAHLVALAANAVAPGGQLLVVDALGDGSKESAKNISVYGLHLAMRSAQGRVYNASDVAGWMKSAGLGQTREQSLPTDIGPFGAVLGTA